jgi:hypothetical protein
MAENVGFDVRIGMDISEMQAELQKSQNLLREFQSQLKKSTNTIEINMLNNEIKTLNGTISNLEMNMQKAGKPMGDASQSLINFSRIAQDAPYGIQGIANNLNPMIESFQRLAKTEGGTKKALEAMVGGLAGPAGVGVAIGLISSLAVTFSKQISEMFETPTEKLKEFREELKKLKEDVYAIVGGVQANRTIAMGYSSIIGSDKIELEDRKTALKYLKDIYKENKEIQALTISSSTEYMNFAINRAAKQQEYQGKEKNNADVLKKIYTEINQLEGERAKALANIKQEFGADGVPMYDLEAVRKRTNDNYDKLIENAKAKLPEALKAGRNIQLALVGFETIDGKGSTGAKPKIEKEFDYVTAIKKRSVLSGGDLEAVKEDTTIKDMEKSHQQHLNWLSKYYKFKMDLARKSGEENKKVLEDQQKSYESFAKQLSGSVVNALQGVYDAMQKGDSFGKAFLDMLAKITEQLVAMVIQTLIFRAIMAALTGGGSEVGIAASNVAGSAGRILMIPKYAEGGIVNKPHIGMVGEAGPEAIIPLSKLSGFLNTSFNAGAMSGGGGMSNGGSFVLKGNDLVLALQRSNYSLNLRRGI